MKLLIVAATRAEIEPLLSYFDVDGNCFKVRNNEVDVLITGVGMVPTAFALGQKLTHQRYDFVINLGIAGSFDPDVVIGDVVLVNQDVFSEWGAEDGEKFLSIDDLGFGKSVQLANFLLFWEQVKLKGVKGITVNKVHGNELSIAKTITRLHPQVESMEGAAFFYACNQMSTDGMQIRAISNHVERRNREKWDINLAIKNLNEFAVNFLNRMLVLEVHWPLFRHLVSVSKSQY